MLVVKLSLKRMFVCKYSLFTYSYIKIDADVV